MGSPHKEEKLIGGKIDLDLLFQIPQEDARIIGGKGEKASSRGSTMEVKFVPKNPRKLLGKKPLLLENQI